MSNHEDLIRLRHMLDHALEAVALMQGKKRSDLDSSRLLQLALVRLIEIIGEAASRVSRKTQGQHAQIPWAQIVSMRNRLVHGYDFVDFDILWQTVSKELPEIITELERIVPPKEA